MADRLSSLTTAAAVVTDRVRGSDPGLGRLRQALAAVVGLGSALGIEYLLAAALGRPALDRLVFMLLGAVVAMMGSMALTTSAGARDKIRTAAGFPVAIGVGLLLGVAVGPHTDLMLSVFVVVMFAAVYVRRFGLPFFFYGFMLWMGYFFAAFLHATLGMLPGLLLAVVTSAAWVTLLATTVLRQNPARTLAHVIKAFESRTRAVAAACADLTDAVLDESGAGASRSGRRAARLRRRLVARQAGLAETALIAEAWCDDPGAAASGWSGPAIRRRLLDVQHVTDELADATLVLAHAVEDDGATPAARRAGALLRALARRQDARARRLAEHLGRPVDHRATDRATDRAARALAHAVGDLLEAAAPTRPSGAGETAAAGEEFSPVSPLMMGNLPGSPAVARDIVPRSRDWNPLARLDMVTRQAVQVALSGGLAIVLGRELSTTRYYWAVIAAFVAFTGTATRGETIGKATSRVIGTLVGLVASIWLAELTAGSTPLVLLVVLGSMFLGFYLIRVSYAYMIFFITIMVGQLYAVLNEFSDGLLVLRLEETAIGAAVGIAVAIVVTPLSTRDTVRVARDAALQAVSDFLTAAADTLGGGSADPLDRLTRTVDDRLRQLRVVARPLLRPPALGGVGVRAQHRLSLYTAIGAQVRVVAVRVRSGLDESPTPVRALAEATAALADPDAGRTLAQRGAASGTAAALHTCQDMLNSLRHGRDTAADTPSITRPLLHLQALLAELAGVTPTERRPAQPGALQTGVARSTGATATGATAAAAARC